jgi:plasmid stabilization system protein ParE
MRVRYNSRALRQIEQIHRDIAQQNPRAAVKVIARVKELCERLGEFPGMGPRTDRPTFVFCLWSAIRT